MKPNIKQLTEQWKKLYDEVSDDDLLVDSEFESLCIGWCLAKGLSVQEGLKFYQRMISVGYF